VAQFQAPLLPEESVPAHDPSFGGSFATCAAISAVMDVSCWVALALAPLAAGFLVRIFIIQHDYGHLSFFRSRRANDIVGFACCLLTLMPYPTWRRANSITDLAVQEEAVIGSGGDSIGRNKFRRTTGHQAIIWLACER
jgi:omega-6 fatty acid desaturase (delta-12 desaturase)